METIFKNELYDFWYFVCKKDLKKRLIISESQFYEFIKSILLLRNKSLKIKIIEKEFPITEHYLCEIDDSISIEKLWVSKEIVTIWFGQEVLSLFV